MDNNAEMVLLEILAAQGEYIESQRGVCTPQFRSVLLQMERDSHSLLLDRCANEAANTALLAMPCAGLQIEWGEWRIAFVAENPTPVVHRGIDAIRLQLPGSVGISRRRLYRRAPDPRPPLRCVHSVNGDVIFEFAVTDVSQGGLSMKIDFAVDELEPGMILTGCRLECADREPVSVDLEVEHTTCSTLASGSRVGSIGVRFLSLSPPAMALIAEYAEAKPPR